TRGAAFLLRAGITHSFPTSHRHGCRECEVVEEAASDREGSPNHQRLPTGPCRARRGVYIVVRSASSLHLPCSFAVTAARLQKACGPHHFEAAQLYRPVSESIE